MTRAPSTPPVTVRPGTSTDRTASTWWRWAWRTRPGSRAAEPVRQAEVVPLPSLAKLESWLGLSAAGEPAFVYRLVPGAAPRRGPAAGSSTSAAATARTAGRSRSSASSPPAPGWPRPTSGCSSSWRATRAASTGSSSSPTTTWPSCSRCWPRAGWCTAARRCASRPSRRAPRSTSPPPPTARGPASSSSSPTGAPPAFDTSMLLVGRRSASLLDGQEAYRLEPDLPPRLWRAWLLEPSMSFPAGQVERALSFFAAHLPRFDLRLRADGLDVVEDETPELLLSLEGTRGAGEGPARRALRLGHGAGLARRARTWATPPRPGPKGRTLFRRQEAMEREAGQRLLGPGLQVRPQHRHLRGQRRCGDRTSGPPGLAELPKEWERFVARPPRVKLRRRLRPRVRVSTGGNWFELDARFETDDQPVDLGAVRLWLKSGRRFMPAGRRQLRRGRPRGDQPRRGSARGGRGAAGHAHHPAAARTRPARSMR